MIVISKHYSVYCLWRTNSGDSVKLITGKLLSMYANQASGSSICYVVVSLRLMLQRFNCTNRDLQTIRDCTGIEKICTKAITMR